MAFGRWRAADVRSILAAGPGRLIPGLPGTRWYSSCPWSRCPWSRSGRRRTTPSAGCHDRSRAAAAPDLTEGLRRLKLAAMRQLAPELLLTAKTQRWAPEELLRTLVEAEISARDASSAGPG